MSTDCKSALSGLVFNDKGTISFQLTINRADKREYGSVSDLAVTTGHEAFIHLERRIELLLKAYESGDMKEVQRVYKEIRKNMNGGINSNEHKRYINNHPDYQRIKSYYSQLEKVLNPKEVREAVTRDNNKYKSLKD